MTDQPRPTYTVSIVCFNRLDMTRPCIESVLEHSGTEYELVVTDNASTDGTAEYLRDVAANRPWIRIVTNSANAGFQLPQRRAFEGSRGPFFIALNNDCVVCPRWLEEMRAHFMHDPRLAICGLSSGCSKLHADFHGYQGMPLEYVEGSCFMVRSAMIRKLPGGLFAEDLHFAYGEDSDLCLRARQAGLEVGHVAVPIQHRGQATSSQVAGIAEIERENHGRLQYRWGHYLRVRRFDHPIKIRRRGALGDVFIAGAAIEALHTQRPLSKIYVETDCPQVLAHHPAITACAPSIPTLDGEEFFDLDMAYENRPGIPIVRAYLEALRIGDAFRANLSPHFRIAMADAVWASRVLCDEIPYAAIHSDASWPGKTWPDERFLEIARAILAAGWGVVTVGNGRGLIHPHSLDLRNRTTVGQLAGVIERCRLFVGIDSFPMHVAIGCGIPTVGIFGASSPEMVAPAGLSNRLLHPVRVSRDVAACVGERHRVAGATFVGCDGACMRAVTVDHVLTEINPAIEYERIWAAGMVELARAPAA